MMIRKIFLLVVTISFQSFSQEECSDFKNGEFYTETPNLGRTLITRNDSIQVEINEQAGYHYVHKVEWISECEYQLTLIRNNSTNPQFEWPEDSALVMKINMFEISGSSYKVNANLNGGPFRYGGLIKMLKQGKD